MKKVIFIAIVAVASLASCKKDRVCTCTSTGSSTASVKTYTKAKKSDARAACLSTTQTSTYGSYVQTCELK
ncbi:MAG TPA: hypothetical protein VF868_07850 [Bacteroidia bacterium]|jgi:hypothetical protein